MPAEHAPTEPAPAKTALRTAKTVLLLGAESTGVPAPLLAEVDACVEIPQRGLLRSLNVHVSAAIAAYELLQNDPATQELTS